MPATGGAAIGGSSATGGVAAGGAATGGTTTGGTTTTGGAATGGAATGGAPTGGTSAIGGATAATGGSTNSTAYTIGHNEVPMPLYALWLAGNPSTDGQPPECSWNADFTPTCNWEPMKYLLHPVVCVDWCDAYAYCKAMGQRLCGKNGGGANDFNQFADAAQSQWQALCTSGGQYLYPYGNTYSSTNCNGSDAGNAKVVDIGSTKTCQSPDSKYANYFDMSGNVMEWEDSCRSSDDNCRLRGGSFNSTATTSLACSADASAPRNTTAADIGFRCCPAP
jgi:formylglycine-generating enzyme required for sulfatase activity